PGTVGPLKSYISLRMENRGGAPGGTPEVYFTDPDGLLMQLQDAIYCGGAGFLRNVCAGGSLKEPRMAFSDFIKKQFIDIIQYPEDVDGMLAYRYPIQAFELQYGAQL